jgi:hypothetical protein
MPDGYPVAIGEPPSVDRVNRRDFLVHGIDIRFHPTTKLPLQNGSGAMPDDEQAWRTHLPLILQTQGRAAYEAMKAKLENERK